MTSVMSLYVKNYILIFVKNLTFFFFGPFNGKMTMFGRVGNSDYDLGKQLLGLTSIFL